jgi:N-acetyl-anhydromuramyl-L-alanine amidase AmpD
LGSTSKDGINFNMHKESVGIEICNFGPLTQKNNKFYTYTGTQIKSEFVCDLGYKFRGYQYWHKYTPEQLHSIEHLLIMLANKYKIDLNKGLKDRLSKMDPAKAFDFYSDAVNGKVNGLLSHTNVRKDKFDVFPQPELVDLIKSL